ncbi:MAG: nuclear transport factor 2 family protein [Acidimicrobiales bacterium]
MNSEDAIGTGPKSVVCSLFEIINARRFDRLGELLSDDVRDENRTGPERRRAPQPFDGIPAQFAKFDPYEVTVHELIVEGARVVAVVSQRGVHRDHPTSVGHAFENEAAYLFSVEAGRITRVRAISDGRETAKSA